MKCPTIYQGALTMVCGTTLDVQNTASIQPFCCDGLPTRDPVLLAKYAQWLSCPVCKMRRHPSEYMVFHNGEIYVEESPSTWKLINKEKNFLKEMLEELPISKIEAQIQIKLKELHKLQQRKLKLKLDLLEKKYGKSARHQDILTRGY